MTRTLLRLCIGVFVLAPLVACESEKSANPLSPTVAGPIPGVNITPPKPLEPGNGWQLKGDKQPVTLLLENASSNGVRPLSYVFEVARPLLRDPALLPYFPFVLLDQVVGHVARVDYVIFVSNLEFVKQRRLALSYFPVLARWTGC